MKRKFEELQEEKITKKRKCLASNLQDLIDIANTGLIYKNLDMNILWRILPYIVKLNNMTGMEKLKKSIFFQILYYVQKLDNKNTDYLHTAIFGDPGCGKTTVAMILGELYNSMGILSENKFIVAKKTDFVGKYLGHTADKTLKFLESCLGGVLFIDEIYSFSSGKKDADSFSKEAIDILNAFMSENKNNLMVIIAGYEEEVKKCFFNVNKGLESRFQWSHVIEKFTEKELALIFLNKVYEFRWKLLITAIEVEQIIKKNFIIFKNLGRDMEKLFTYTKLCHSKRVFGLEKYHRYKITLEDLNEGVELFKENMEKQKDNNIPEGMYI